MEREGREVIEKERKVEEQEKGIRDSRERMGMEAE